MEALEETLRSCGQEHLLEVPAVFAQLSKFDIAESVRRFKFATGPDQTQAQDEASLSPIENALVFHELREERQTAIAAIGWKALAEGKVAAVIMSGGQGTRLGFAGPKGCYNISLPSNKSIFQLHMERISKVRQLSGAASIPVYIMTSDLNDSIIRNFFAQHSFFGYPEADVFFFEQGLEPCFSLDGKVIIESRGSLSLAPDGNGGIYPALRASGALKDMERRGVEHLHVYGIDNVLTKSLDPNFLGAAIEAGAQVANKVVWRADKAEKVGVTARRGSRVCVVEYSELPAHLADAADETSGKLLFGAANICNHYLSLSFLQTEVLPALAGAAGLKPIYHVAKKKIPSLDAATGATVTPTAVNGIKLELFIFDVFPLAERWLVFETRRKDEFAPVKNEPGNAVDSPDTARRLVSAQAARWLEKVGAAVYTPPAAAATDDAASAAPVVFGDIDPAAFASGLAAEAGAAADNGREPLLEISPLLSYCGEGLERFSGAVVRPPVYLE
jgi:UDP-N-acetylglucosamine/UDP-N-acetylgalactosamine diphosphorylase